MRRGTTPTLELAIKNKDLSAYRCIVTMEQGEIELEKDIEPVYQDPDTILSVDLSQEETLAFGANGYMQVQVRGINSEGAAIATNIKKVYIADILKEGVIEYEG